MTHRELCLFGAQYMKSKGTYEYGKAKYVVCELERIGECPDVFGFGGGRYTQLIEVKVSRADFFSDKHKYWRQNPLSGLGMMRSYLCPKNVIKVEDLPLDWGLFYIDDKYKIECIKRPVMQMSSHVQEIDLICSILRRENVKSQIFSYKKYKYKTN